jgi:hypothetical protein
MNLSDIHVSEKKPLVLASPAEVDALEASLWINFPDGYREYITKLGEGVLGGSLVRIYPPWRIQKELVDWRRRIAKYWFWDEGRELLPKERALECIIIGDTLNGDELIFHPLRPSQLFVLPRGGSDVFIVRDNLFGAVEWMCDSGKLVKPFTERNFESFDTRDKPSSQRTGGEKVVDPEGESLDRLVELGTQWSIRHSARKMAQKDLKQHTGPNRKAKLLYEAFVIEGEYPIEPGYLVAYRIDDKDSGLEVGVFTWCKTEDSHGSQYAPNQANVTKLRKSK